VSIKARVGDALLLWERQHHEGALLFALTAVAATSRRRYPDRKVADRDAFERFLTSAHTVRLSVEFRGECHPIEHILYKWFRCELVHEGGLPVDIEFTSSLGSGLSVRAGGAPAFKLLLSHGWFQHLLQAVSGAPENAAEFSAAP
jgi:hypothetical protein